MLQNLLIITYLMQLHLFKASVSLLLIIHVEYLD